MKNTNSNTHKLAGVFSALITPNKEDGSLNLDMLASIAEFQLHQGLHGFYVGGSTGEAFLQNALERKAILKEFSRVVNGRAKLIAHIGAISTDEAIDLAEAAADAGYDAISAIPPFYYDFSSVEVLSHYQLLANATPLPLIVYNYPAKSSRPLTTSDLLTLLENPKIIGVKHTSQNLFQLERLKTAAPESVIYNGFDEMFVGGLAMGADGGIGSTFNVMGRLFVEIYEAMQAGDLDHAHLLQIRANQVIAVLIEVGVFPGLKTMMKILGMDCGSCRRPFMQLTNEQISKVEQVLDKSNLLIR